MSIRLPSRAVLAVALLAIPAAAHAQPGAPTLPPAATVSGPTIVGPSSPNLSAGATVAPSDQAMPTLSASGVPIAGAASYAPIAGGTFPGGTTIVDSRIVSDRIVSPGTTSAGTVGTGGATLASGFSEYGVPRYGLGIARPGFPYLFGGQRINVYQLDSQTYDSMYGYIGHGGITAQAQMQRAAVNAWVYGQAVSMPWHGQYYHTNYGRPVALVVPPTAAMQTKWAWGVGNTVSVPIYHQFGRQYPGPGMGMVGPNGVFLPTPHWPSNTDQFGVYYVRGPW